MSIFQTKNKVRKDWRLLFIPRLFLTLFFSPTPTPLEDPMHKSVRSFSLLGPPKDLKEYTGGWLPSRSCLTLSYSSLTLLSSRSTPYPGITYWDMGNTFRPSTLFSYFCNPWQPPLALLPSCISRFFIHMFLSIFIHRFLSMLDIHR